MWVDVNESTYAMQTVFVVYGLQISQPCTEQHWNNAWIAVAWKTCSLFAANTTYLGVRILGVTVICVSPQTWRPVFCVSPTPLPSRNRVAKNNKISQLKKENDISIAMFVTISESPEDANAVFLSWFILSWFSRFIKISRFGNVRLCHCYPEFATCLNFKFFILQFVSLCSIWIVIQSYETAEVVNQW